MNRITELFDIKYPIIQAGMIWCSGWELASAVSNAGGLGLIGAGSMTPDVLRLHIRKCKKATDKPFGVNLPLIMPYTEELIEIIIDEGVKIVFTSAGNPVKWTPFLKSNGLTVAHVIANSKFARKSEESGVDVVVAEGFEAGGHNGREETTTMVLIPMIREATSIPIIAAGGIATGSQMLACFALGAEGIQVGSRFVVSVESSAHPLFKESVVNSKEGQTMLALKTLVPVRLLRNQFFDKIQAMERECVGTEELLNMLGKGRAKLGMFDGNTDEGELEIGQISGLINDIKPASMIVDDIMCQFRQKMDELKNLKL